MEQKQLDNILKKISLEYEKITLDELVPHTNSFTNTIYSAGEKYILRICTKKSNEKNFIRASNFCINHQDILKTPKTYYSQLFENETGMYFTLIEKVKGDLLTNVWTSLDSDQKRNVIGQLAAEMRIIHNIEDDMFFDIFLQPSDWKAKFYHDINMKLQMLLEKNVIEDDFYYLIFNYLNDNIDSLNEANFSICHSDLHFDNIMLNACNNIVILDYDRLRKASIDYELDVLNRMCYRPTSVLHLNKKFAIDMNLVELLGEYYPQILQFQNINKRLKIYGIKQYLNILSFVKTVDLKKEIIDFIRQ